MSSEFQAPVDADESEEELKESAGAERKFDAWSTEPGSLREALVGLEDRTIR
ncbi:hypothetical protein [Cellulomonas xiejunii]|uniref:Uncharacterized protein n=1 Tax=Cellulomonas xiejunii TaxID=2968083 RepID=A0ABY5KN80_9CELL|nr:hypothetical protein [Cellulomonas xiejunii]MCC2321359.1 hypothetical protein [Cellulomonas xiejunii]UUI71944.1 hypothetical protein NP048_00245 [Cellulomonas xiejunii]